MPDGEHRRTELLITPCGCEACNELDLWKFKFLAVVEGRPYFGLEDFEGDDGLLDAILDQEPRYHA